MGKKNKKKETNAFGYRYKSGDVGDMMRRYGVEGTASYHPSMRGPGGKENRDKDDVNRDLAAKMSNDYDTRRTIEAAAMAGNKKAKKYAKKGINEKNIYEAYDVMKKLKKKYVGGGGMRGSKNEAGLTWAAVNKDRDKLKGYFDEKYGGDGNDSDGSNNIEDTSPSLGDAIAAGTISKAVRDADARVHDLAVYRTSGEESENRYTDDTNEGKRDDKYTQDRAFSFLNEYKLDLQSRYGK